MSFFGFDPSLPGKGGHKPSAPGFSQPRDPFAELARARDELPDDAPVLNYDENYEGQDLDDGDDAFNDDTFGGTGSAARDFDFYGSTAKVADTITKEQDRFHGSTNRSQAPPQAQTQPPMTQPDAAYRTGYERYQDPRSVPDLQINQAIWGQAARQNRQVSDPRAYVQAARTSVPPTAPPVRQAMTLEEVEASMRAQRKAMSVEEVEAAMKAAARSATQATKPSQQLPHRPAAGEQTTPLQSTITPVQALYQSSRPLSSQAPEGPRQISQQSQLPHHTAFRNQRLPLVSQPGTGPEITAPIPQHGAGFMSQPSQILGMTEEQRATALAEDAKRAKRNHKIFLMARGNGLMTPSDKNFITRIQLQSLISATSNSADSTRSALVDDFYYEVMRQLRASGRNGANQAYNSFAQTYLFETGVRIGGRRVNRAMYQTQRMEQQVERAVEAVKLRPKASQLTMANTLGKISYSNSKTPKPLLNIKRPDPERRPSSSALGGGGATEKRKSRRFSLTTDRKLVLRDIEALFSALIACESHVQAMPPAPQEGDHEGTQQRIEWTQRSEVLNQALWIALRMDQPLEEDPTVIHPFIAMLAFSKGKKAISRAFRFLDPTRQINVLTLIVVYLDQLDVVRLVVAKTSGSAALPPSVKTEVQLFNTLIIPPLFQHVSEAPLAHISGLVGILISRNNVRDVLRTQVGLSILSMLLSRASIIKQVSSGGGAGDESSAPGTPGGSVSGANSAGHADQLALDQWAGMYDSLFKAVEPWLAETLQARAAGGGKGEKQGESGTTGGDEEEVHVWRFLASLGTGASHEQQQRLCLAVVDQVRDTLAGAKAMPKEQGLKKRANVNLFMQSIGLDVDMLDGGL